MELCMRIVQVLFNSMNMEKGLEFSSLKSHIILKHKPGCDNTFNAYLNILYISHHELQESVFLKSHSEQDVRLFK